MGVLGIESDARTQVLQVVSAVLALGNVSFAQTSGAPADAPLQPSDAAWLEGVAGLLGIGAHALGTKLTSRTVSAGRGSTYTVSLGARECEEARDSLAQSLYVNAFECFVATVNACVRKGADAGTAPGEDQRFVGLLDIFGFENFQVNSFEQLCINFTNERLQGQFMDALVKLRVLEYEREGVPVAEIDFPDNEAQLALIDGKSLGIFAALDDECSVPKGADAGFVEKMHELFAKGKPHASPVYDQLRRAKGGVLAGEKTGKELPSLGPDLDRLSFLVVCVGQASKYSRHARDQTPSSPASAGRAACLFFAAFASSSRWRLQTATDGRLVNRLFVHCADTMPSPCGIRQMAGSTRTEATSTPSSRSCLASPSRRSCGHSIRPPQRTTRSGRPSARPFGGRFAASPQRCCRRRRPTCDASSPMACARPISSRAILSSGR